MNINTIENDFLQLLKEQSAYQEAIMLTHWDMRTKIPKKAVEQRSNVVGILSEKLHSIETSDEMKHFIDVLKNRTENEVVKRAIEVCEETYEQNKKIPKEEFKEFVMLQSRAESVWQEAREKSDFTLFQPYLEQLVTYNKKFASYWGYDDNLYDALLHRFEPGMTTKQLDDVFLPLRESLTNLVDKINKSDHQLAASKLLIPFPKQDQEAFSVKVLEEMGYDFTSGRLDETVHPFAIPLNRNDVRVTTRYDEQDFRMAIFGTIHEGGHALYEQNIHPKLSNTPLSTGTSMGIHESQSLFWENFIGRRKSFWESHYDTFLTYAPKPFQNIELEEFYRLINDVQPSYIRIEADELTYCLHIMIRYELEKALMNDELAVKDLPEAWNEKMVEYLGIKPPNDRLGVLQDIHWSSGDFGYFPSYALGYIYAAQFHHVLDSTNDIDSFIKNGDFHKIRQWLTEHIHQFGKMKKPLDIVQEVTEEDINPQYLIQYLTDKYTKIYQL
ncbi:carboxypeptidase M32 [Oceanobacillus halotolerans]|uniref:carboxypeptidase M32 n=1 Tax=Oceanobacillus halotolerans TaxID=2663380 RepID=UPI0013D8EB44|nr:carboxypeptidase M32 [Oceanobacillus halotolerans]